MEFSGTTAVFIRRIQAMGIRDRPTSFRSPWRTAMLKYRSLDDQRETSRQVPRFSLCSVDWGLLGGVWQRGLTCVPLSDLLGIE